ncbi:hypothetical protein [Amycolatopsis sp. NPDC049159]|uniref:hypothetical protein n=1 Tax=Amycolatopsis sp. NPDC049159 TaxID=3157210 RepID=UPI0033E097C3
MSELSPRLRDEIDDQVAEALDAYLAERGDVHRARRVWPLWLAIALTNLTWLVVVSVLGGGERPGAPTNIEVHTV